MAINRARAMLLQALTRLPDDFLQLVLEASEGRSDELVARLRGGAISRDDQEWLAVLLDKRHPLKRRQGRPKGISTVDPAIGETAADIKSFKADLRAMGHTIYARQDEHSDPEKLGHIRIRDFVVQARKDRGLPVPEGEEGLQSLENYMNRGSPPRTPRKKNRAN